MSASIKISVISVGFLLCSLVVTSTWGAEVKGGRKIDAATNRLYIGGGAFSYYCAKKLPKAILLYNVAMAEKVGEIQMDYPIEAYDIGPGGNLVVMDQHLNMHIFSSELKLLRTIPDVMADEESICFDWNAAGDKLVYLARHPDRIPYRKVLIFDLKTGTIEKIADEANSVRWAKFDGNIYYKIPRDDEGDGWVCKYDVAKKTTTKTKLLGVVFSADGAYYIGSRSEGEGEIPYYQIYDTSDNWVEPDADIDVAEVYKLGMYNHFLGNSHKVLTRWGAPVSIFDVDTRKYVRPDMGLGLLGWSTDDSQLLFSPGECKVRIEDALTGQVIKEWTVDPGK